MKVQGTLRSWGNNHMAVLVKRWETGFRKYHPDIRFEDKLKSTAMAQWGLHEWAADLAVMGRQIWPGPPPTRATPTGRSEEHTSELQSPLNLVCPLLL